MPLTSVHSSEAPAAVGPYSQAVACGGLVFVSGQIALDPTTGRLAEDDIRLQTAQVITNLKAILEAAGTDVRHVLKTEVFLADMEDYAAMNEVYDAHFTGEVKPARQAVEVSALPKNARIEMSCVAELPGGH